MKRKKILLSKENSLYRGPGQEAALHIQGEDGQRGGRQGGAT